MTIDQLKTNTEEILEYVSLKNEDIIVSTQKGNVVIMSEKDYSEYLIDHFNIIYQRIREKL